MANIKRTATIIVEVEHLKNSSVFGKITDDILREHLQAWVDSIFIETPIYEEHGDFYTVSKPTIVLNQHDDTLCIVDEADNSQQMTPS